MSLQSSEWFSILMMLAGQLPLFLVWLVGLILAIVRWGRHPRVSSFVLVAVFLAAGTSVSGQIVFRLLPQFADSSVLPNLFPFVSICMSVMHAVAWGCMLLATFSGRESHATGTPFGPSKKP
jgi:hypothetical protein